MNTLYLDIFSGISGDMFIGACLDVGVEPRALEAELRKLKVGGYHLHWKRGQKSAIEGLKFDVHLAHEHDHDHGHGHEHHHHHDHEHHEHDHHEHEHEHGRSFKQIRGLIEGSELSPWVKEKAVAVFARIAKAEGKIHGCAAEEVHFHEVGAVDSIVDIVGACICLEMLGKPRVLASSVQEGTGFINCAHGRFPIPAPATLNILGDAGVAITQCEEPHELVTPTGAAILAEFVERYGPMRKLVAKRVGFGLGTRDNKTRPNVLRAVLGTAPQTTTGGTNDWEMDAVVCLETNLDDCLPEALGPFIERALAAGALDAFHTAIQMKKNRPGVLLTVLCSEANAEALAEMMLRETTAFGLRRSILERRKLRREIVQVETAHGPAPVKIGRLNGKVVQASPEFEAIRELAAKHNLPILALYREAQAAAQKLFEG